LIFFIKAKYKASFHIFYNKHFLVHLYNELVFLYLI